MYLCPKTQQTLREKNDFRCHFEERLVVVVYRETGEDGFIITVFITRKAGSLDRRKQLLP